MAAPKVLEVVQNDVLTTHPLTIYEYDGTPMDLTLVTEIKIYAAAPGGTVLALDTTCTRQLPYANGVCHYIKQSDELNIVGLYHAELQITDSGGVIVTTKRFDIRVVKDLP